jgi:hypothetical protein
MYLLLIDADPILRYYIVWKWAVLPTFCKHILPPWGTLSTSVQCKYPRAESALTVDYHKGQEINIYNLNNESVADSASVRYLYLCLHFLITYFASLRRNPRILANCEYEKH